MESNFRAALRARGVRFSTWTRRGQLHVFMFSLFFALILSVSTAFGQTPASYPYQPTDKVQWNAVPECTTSAQCASLTPRLYVDGSAASTPLANVTCSATTPFVCTSGAIGNALVAILNAWTVGGHSLELDLFSAATGASAKSAPFVSSGPTLKTAPTGIGLIR